MRSTIHESIISQPSYWIEAVNGMLYEAVTGYMEKNKLNRTRMAEHLGISKGRLSQILNDGNINFSLEKIIEIALKVGKYPVLTLEDRESLQQFKMHTEKDLSWVK
jgi:predicted XRE-type DNA-binding protein